MVWVTTEFPPSNSSFNSPPVQTPSGTWHPLISSEGSIGTLTVGSSHCRTGQTGCVEVARSTALWLIAECGDRNEFGSHFRRTTAIRQIHVATPIQEGAGSGGAFGPGGDGCASAIESASFDRQSTAPLSNPDWDVICSRSRLDSTETDMNPSVPPEPASWWSNSRASASWPLSSCFLICATRAGSDRPNS